MRIAVFNQKGGVGKTTTTLNLAAAAHHLQCPALCIDLDPQAHLTLAHGNARGGPARSLYAFFERKAALNSLTITWPSIGKLLPAHPIMVKVESIFGAEPKIIRRLSEALADKAFSDVDIFMDCAPFLGVLSLNAMAAADLVLVPVASDMLSMHGAEQISHTLNALEKTLKRPIARRYVLTRYNARRKSSEAVYERMTKVYGSQVCKTTISESASLTESMGKHLDIFQHAPRTRAAKEYSALFEELSASL